MAKQKVERRQYSDAIKQQALERYRKGERAEPIAEDLGLSTHQLVYAWSRSKKGKMLAKRKGATSHTDEEKRAAVARLDAGEYAKDIAPDYGCHSSVIYVWRKKFAANGSAGIPQIAKPKRKSPKKKTTRKVAKPKSGPSIMDRIEELEREVVDLRWQLGLD